MIMNKQVRELILQQLFSQTFYEKGAEDISFIQEIEESSLPVQKLVKSTVLGIEEHEVAILEAIQKLAKNWSLQRIGRIELAAMKLSIYEMTYHTPAVDPAVSINAAVEMVKRYGNEKAFKFVNGILDSYRKELIKKD